MKEITVLVVLSLLPNIVSADGKCGSGWFQHRNSCYFISERQKFTWFDAWNACWILQGYPVEISSRREQRFLGKKMSGGIYYTGGHEIMGRLRWHTGLRSFGYRPLKWRGSDKKKFRNRKCIAATTIRGQMTLVKSRCHSLEKIICERPVSLFKWNTP
ncbi:perlucin-like protein [Ostrea edulis]|uniref:perlucin-like protein n=1 Tax=Ostrea edulis TaxID=37623 RepID=UPI002095471C|nr:perlucin-like protein [Ostrea edulis]